MNFEEIITALPGQVNIILLICLMAIGYIIKHMACFKKVSNNLIPIIVVVVALIVTLLTGDLSSTTGIVSAIMSGIINAALAVWAHETGKNIFELIGKTNSSGSPPSDKIGGSV